MKEGWYGREKGKGRYRLGSDSVLESLEFIFLARKILLKDSAEPFFWPLAAALELEDVLTDV